MRDNFSSQPSTPEDDSRRKTKDRSSKARSNASQNDEINKKRENLSSDNEEDEEEEAASETTEPVAPYNPIHKKIKTSSDHSTQETVPVEDPVSASPSFLKQNIIKPQQIQAQQVQAKAPQQHQKPQGKPEVQHPALGAQKYLKSLLLKQSLTESKSR